MSWDGGSGNRLLAKHLVTAHTDTESEAIPATGVQPHYFVCPASGQRVFIVSDPDHLLKRMRNAVFNSGRKRSKLSEEDKFVRTLYSPKGQRLSWDHCRAAYALDKFSNGTLRATYVVERAIILHGADDMRVSFALSVCAPSFTNWLLCAGRSSEDERCTRFFADALGPFGRSIISPTASAQGGSASAAVASSLSAASATAMSPAPAATGGIAGSTISCHLHQHAAAHLQGHGQPSPGNC